MQKLLGLAPSTITVTRRDLIVPGTSRLASDLVASADDPSLPPFPFLVIWEPDDPNAFLGDDRFPPEFEVSIRFGGPSGLKVGTNQLEIFLNHLGLGTTAWAKPSDALFRESSEVGNDRFQHARPFYRLKPERVELYDHRARWYDRTTRRFLSPDPLGPVDSPNLYQAFLFDGGSVTDPFGFVGDPPGWRQTLIADGPSPSREESVAVLKTAGYVGVAGASLLYWPVAVGVTGYYLQDSIAEGVETSLTHGRSGWFGAAYGGLHPAFAAYEAAQGETVFGQQLSGLERGLYAGEAALSAVATYFGVRGVVRSPAVQEGFRALRREAAVALRSEAGFAKLDLLVPGAGDVRVPTKGAIVPYDQDLAAQQLGSLPKYDSRVLLRAVVSKSDEMLYVNPRLARDLMTPGSYRHLKEGTKLASASYGKAVERLSARIIADDHVLSRVFHYTGRARGANGRFITSPDFIAVEAGRTRMLDITTDAALSSHRRRLLAPHIDYLTYPGRR